MNVNYKKIIRAGILTLFFGVGSNAYAQYCTPAYTTGCTVGDDLNSVVLNGITTNLSNINTGCNGNYTDNTAMPAPDLSPGLTYTIQAGTSYGSPQFESYKAWIDYDENDVFDPSEEIAAVAGMTSGLNSVSFAVPAATTLGIKRMRVRVVYTTNLTVIDPCSSQTYGETEDYSVEIVAPPSCLPPTNLNVSNVQLTSLDFGWTEANSATEWQVDYGAIGFVPGTGTGSLSTVTANPFNATIVTGNEYDFYVRSICSVGDTSAWTGPYVFKYCDVSSNGTFYYFSSVSSNGAIANANYTSFSHPTGSYADETAQTFESHEAQTFNLNTTFSNANNGVSVWVDWNRDLIFDAAELVASNHSSVANQSLSILVPVGTSLGDYRMRVRGMYAFGSGTPGSACGSTVGGNTTVDFNLTIVTPPSCLAPSTLTASNITSTQAELGWTENGTATSWNIEYGAPGFTVGSGTPATATSNPYTVTITPLSQYEFYVQSDCGGGDLSAWSGPYSFSNQYCLPVYTSTSEYLSPIETIGAIVDASHTTASFPAGGYTDETAQVIQAYETLTFDINTGYNPSTYGYVTKAWVDWNNDFVFDPTNELVSTASGTGGYTQPVTIPAGTPVGTYRMRIRGEYGTTSNPGPCTSETWGSAVDFTLDIIAPPSCLPVMDIDTVNVSTTSIELDWTELNGATSWTLEYGPAGFTQGSGTTVTVTTNPFTITPLSPSTNYDFYIQADCGGGDLAAWRGPFSQYTDCGIIIAPYYEALNSGVEPQCWLNESSLVNTGANNFWKFSGQAGKVPGTFAWVDGDFPYSDSVKLTTPQIDLSQMTAPYLAFEWFSNNTNVPGDNNPLIVELYDGTSWILLDSLSGDNPEWQFENYDLGAYINNLIQIRFTVNKTAIASSAWNNDILLDEIIIDECIDLGGIDGSYDVCRLDLNVDLDDNIITKPNGGGEWSFPNQPSFLTDSLFTVELLPAGSYDVFYVERNVCYDTTFATINVFNASSAGIDGATDACKNAPVNLYGSIGGNADLGGDWYDYNNALLPNSQPKVAAIPGNYNYLYIANNGVCPSDTAIVTVTVLGDCDWLSVGEELFADISVYPNPATSQINIVNPSNTAELKVEMFDMNGRSVLVENKALDNASEGTIMIEHLEKGIYTLRVYNSEAQKTFKVVKQ